MGFFTDELGEFRTKRVVRLIGFVAVVLFVLILYFTNIYTVQTGEVAIVSTNGSISRVDGPGLHFKYPLIQSKVFMETREKSYIFGKTEEQDATLEVSTKDMQSIKLEFTVQANIQDPEKLYRDFGLKYQERFVRPRVKEIVQATIAKYTIEEFVTKRAQISTEIFNDLQDDFARYGMVVSNVSIVNHDFSDEYEKAIEAKKVAEQKVETAKAESAKSQVEAENRVKIAEYALKEKELQAKANEIESNSLTPQLLRKMAIERWNGQLPKVQGSSSSLIKIDE